MYSKDTGITREVGQPFPRRQPAYRQPDRPRMQVPPNYSGHAIVDGEERPLGQIQEAESAPESVTAEGPTPRFDDLPRVSDLPRGGDSHRRPQVRTVPATFEESALEAYEERTEPAIPSDAVPATPAAVPPAPTATVVGPMAAVAGSTVAKPASAPRGLFDLSRFPFGHGIGFEELLILGLILFLLHESGECEDRGDIDETVILLGLLLLLG